MIISIVALLALTEYIVECVILVQVRGAADRPKEYTVTHVWVFTSLIDDRQWKNVHEGDVRNHWIAAVVAGVIYRPEESVDIKTESSGRWLMFLQ